jgi:Fe-S cluster assembly ATP-binding protein
MSFLEIKKLTAGIKNKTILHDFSLKISTKKITALMGPNGSGKSTLSHVLMGNPEYSVKKGTATWQNKNILRLEPDQRAKAGIFLAFQYPLEIPGVSFYEFLLTAYQAHLGKKGTQVDFDQRVKQAMIDLSLAESFLQRSINEGFSGGEKKKAEILQLLVLRPKLAILDETDSGLDIDALRTIAKAITVAHKKYGIGFLVITHYQRLLTHLKPDVVHVMSGGRIVKSGSGELVKQLEKKGYGWLADKSK